MAKTSEGVGCKRVQDVAAYLGISVPQVYRLVKSGEIPSIRIRDRVIVPWDKFLGWVDAQSNQVAR